MKLSERIEQIIRTHYPWLATDFNGATWESRTQQQERRLAAMEAHFRNLEDRYTDMENRLNAHAQGTRHRQPKPSLPKPDEE